MPRTITRLLAAGTLLAASTLTLTGCAAGQGDNTAPGNDQSSARAAAESYLQDIQHLDSTKLNAILGEDDKLNAKELASLKKSVDLWGQASPYTDFKIASVEKTYDHGTYNHTAEVRYTYRYNGKLVKQHVDVAVDPTVDDKVWFITDFSSFATPVISKSAVATASSTLTINKQVQQATTTTRVFPGIPYDQHVTYLGGLFTPTIIHSCGFLGEEDNACKGKRNTYGGVDKAKVTTLVTQQLAAAVKKLCNTPTSVDFVADDTYTTQGDPKACTVTSPDSVDIDGIPAGEGQSAYATYAAAGNYYQPGTAPTVDVSGDLTDGVNVQLVGGTYKAYDFVVTAHDQGINYDKCGALTCEHNYTYSYGTAWEPQTYEGWYVNLDKTGHIKEFVIQR